ncbi:MAG: hypothetical protein C4312_00380, partial [Thermoflexus sp.]
RTPLHGEYAWDTGVAVDRFLAELKAGRLVGRRCRTCRRVMIPPRMFCEHCFRPTDKWVPLVDTGTVVTFSVCTISWDMRRLEVPEVPAVIAIDGASPGMGILHRLGEVGRTLDEILQSGSGCASRRSGSPPMSARGPSPTSCISGRFRIERRRRCR